MHNYSVLCLLDYLKSHLESKISLLWSENHESGPIKLVKRIEGRGPGRGGVQLKKNTDFNIFLLKPNTSIPRIERYFWFLTEYVFRFLIIVAKMSLIQPIRILITVFNI